MDGEDFEGEDQDANTRVEDEIAAQDAGDRSAGSYDRVRGDRKIKFVAGCAGMEWIPRVNQ